MSRPRKADRDAVVLVDEPSYAVIIDYRSNVYWGRYQAIRTDKLGRAPRGPAFWLDSPELEPIGRISRRPGRIYRANERYFGPPELRGCACQCCPHVAGYEAEQD